MITSDLFNCRQPRDAQKGKEIFHSVVSYEQWNGPKWLSKVSKKYYCISAKVKLWLLALWNWRNSLAELGAFPLECAKSCNTQLGNVKMNHYLTCAMCRTDTLGIKDVIKPRWMTKKTPLEDDYWGLMGSSEFLPGEFWVHESSWTPNKAVHCL